MSDGLSEEFDADVARASSVNAAWFVDGRCCGCGADTVQPGQFAGRECWFRLPKRIRDEVWRIWKASDIDGWEKAADEAVDWFIANPAPAPPGQSAPL